MLNVAVIGCGRWGQNYVRNLSEMGEARLVMCCDTDERKLSVIREMHPIVRTTRSYHVVASSPKVDAVVIATPPATHFPIARTCLLKGKHVLVEKPFTLSSEDALVLVDLAARLKRVLMVGHIMDYHPGMVYLRDLVKSGELGRVYYVYTDRTNLGVVRDDVSVAWDLAPHDVSSLLFLLGEEPVHVSMKGQAFINQGVEDVAFLTLRFPSRVLANVHVSWLDPFKVRRMTVVGERRMVVFDEGDPTGLIRVYNKGVASASADVAARAASPHDGIRVDVDGFGEFQYGFSYGDVYVPKIRMIEPLRSECLHFLECAREGRQPRTDGLNGLSVIRILERAEDSLRLGGEYLPMATQALAACNGTGKGFVAYARSIWKGLRLEKIF